MKEESAKLLAKFQNGDPDAANALVDRYYNELLRLARERLSERLRRRVDPEDILQSVYRSFFRKAKAGQVILERSGMLWYLLVKITINKVLRRIEYEDAAKRTSKVEGHSDALDSIYNRDPSHEEVTILIDFFENFMKKLTTRERIVLEGRFRGDSVETIAGDINQSEATTRRILNRIEQDLRQQLS